MNFQFIFEKNPEHYYYHHQKLYWKTKSIAKQSSTNIIDEQKNRAIGIKLLIIYC